MRSKFGSGHVEETDFELNIASIIDCFTVLMTYLLASASFVSFTAYDVQVPLLNETVAENVSRNKITVYGYLLDSSTLRIEALNDGQKMRERTILLQSDTAQKDLIEMKEAIGSASDLTLIPEKGMEYGNVVSAVKHLQQAHWSVLLGGKKAVGN